MVRILSTERNSKLMNSKGKTTMVVLAFRRRSAFAWTALLCAAVMTILVSKQLLGHQVYYENSAQSPPLPTAQQWYDRVEAIIQANRKRNGISEDSGIAPIIFHLVHTTGDSTFKPMNIRGMESMLFHHPPANVTTTIIIHTPQYAPEDSTMFFRHQEPMTTAPVQKFLDAGFDVHVIPFHMQSIVEAFVHQQFEAGKVPTHVQDILKPITKDVQWFLSELPNHWRTKYWYANIGDMMRLVLLYLFGGMHIDTDVIILRPMMTVPLSSGVKMPKENLPPSNSVGRQGLGSLPNGAIMKFEHRHNEFLGIALQDYFVNFNPKSWGNQCPLLFARVFEALYKKRNDPGEHYVEEIFLDEDPAAEANRINDDKSRTPILTVLPHLAYYPFGWRDVEPSCMSNPPSETKAGIERLNRQPSYTVHLSNSVAKGNPPHRGTVCEWLYNSFCVLGTCDSTVKTKFS